MPRASVKVGPVSVGSGCCVVFVIPALVVGIALFFAFGGIAIARQYVLKHPKREHCKAHYLRKIIVKKHRHEVLCVYAAPKKAAITITPSPTTTPASTASTSVTPPAPVIATVHVHLDPDFMQSTTNPLAITYHYGASATVGSESEPNLPAGVLSLYANGALVCSMKVGSSIAESECPVTYSTTGSQTVMVSYSSSFASVSETYSENIEPFATHTSVEKSNPFECNKEVTLSPLGIVTGKSSWCKYIITVITTNKYGVIPPKKGIWLTFPDGAGYHRFEDGIEIGKSYETVLTFGEVFGLRETKESESCILKIGGNMFVIKEVSNCHHLPVLASYNGNELVGGKYSWLASEDEISLED